MTDLELMKWALYALEGSNVYDWPVVEELKQRLAQPEQEPVAWMNPSWIDPDTRGWASDSFESIAIEGWIPLYTASRQWQRLTPSEITAIELSLRQYHDGDRYDLSLADFANAIEAKLKAKNA